MPEQDPKHSARRSFAHADIKSKHTNEPFRKTPIYDGIIKSSYS
jgi:hypothetical protein